jgi:hypothetical protein
MSIGRIESGFNHGDASGLTTSYADARGAMQFIPSTRQMILDKYGVDAYASPEEAVHAASLLLKDAGYANSPSDAVYSYNHSTDYVNDVLSGASAYGKLDKLAPRAVQGLSTAAPQPKRVSKKLSPYFKKVDGNEHLRFVEPFMSRLVRLAKLSGEPIMVNSGFRTRAEQEASYADYLAGGTLAAKPGTSNHEYGRAADLELTEKQTALLSKVGLSNTVVGGEPWHVEIDPSLTSARDKAGYGTTSPSLGGTTSAGVGGAVSSTATGIPAIGGAPSATPTTRAGATPPLKMDLLNAIKGGGGAGLALGDYSGSGSDSALAQDVDLPAPGSAISGATPTAGAPTLEQLQAIASQIATERKKLLRPGK